MQKHILGLFALLLCMLAQFDCIPKAETFDLTNVTMISGYLNGSTKHALTTTFCIHVLFPLHQLREPLGARFTARSLLD